MDHFNVFEDPLERITYHGAPLDFRLLHRSPDGRQAVFYSYKPEGVRFTEFPADLAEAIYIIEGTITVSRPDGETIAWRAGDLIHWDYEEELAVEFSPGMRSVCFFWSDRELPDFAKGEDVGDPDVERSQS